MNNITDDILSPTQQKTIVRTVNSSEIKWPVNGDCTEFAKVYFDYYFDCGDMVVSTIVCDKELSLEELQEAIRNEVSSVVFETVMTIKYKK